MSESSAQHVGSRLGCETDVTNDGSRRCDAHESQRWPMFRRTVAIPEKGLFPHLPMNLFISVQAMAGSTMMSLTVPTLRRPSDLVLSVSYPPVGPSRRHARLWTAAVRGRLHMASVLLM